MTISSRPYVPETDYLRVRQFLIDTFALYGYHYNWGIERWNFCRYFVAPIHTNYRRHFSVPVLPIEPVRDEVAAWEHSIRLWENDRGEVVAVVNTENEELGEVWTQLHPDYVHLYPEMLDWAEANLADVAHGLGFCKLYVNEGSALEAVARERGYRDLGERQVHRLYEIAADPPAVALPQGFVFRSVADEDDPIKRAMTHTLAFNRGWAPSEWGPSSPYQELAQAPDYRPENDLLMVAPNGDYAAFATIWIDEVNRYGSFEPVGTHPDYQRRGLGTVLLKEGFRRMAAQGIRRSWMDAGNPFYQKVGYQATPHAYGPWIRYFPA